MKKNYYFILGISPTATEDEIKKAYRINAIKYHPDKTFSDPIYTQKFIEIKEAYDYLIDANKRKAFDIEYYEFFRTAEPRTQTAYQQQKQEEIFEQKKEEEELRYDPYKPFYSLFDREQQETSQIPPRKSPWGDTLSESAIFFKLPSKIGKIIGGFTNYSLAKKNRGMDLILKVLKEDIGYLIFFVGIVAVICYYFSKNIQISLIVFASLFLIGFFRTLYIASGNVSREFVNYFIGINGFAFYKKHSKQEYLTKNIEVNFNEITDLVIRVEKRRLNFKYVTTAYQYVWTNNKKNKVVYEISITRDDKQNKLLSQLTEYEFWLNKEAEKYWTVYLLDNMETILQDKGFLEFNIFNWKEGVFIPYIQLGIGYITFLHMQENFTYRFNDIKRMYIKGTNLFLEHKNFEKVLFIFKSGNKNSIPLDALSNRQFFIKAAEILLGYSIA